jgi:hypothetical protein
VGGFSYVFPPCGSLLIASAIKIVPEENWYRRKGTISKASRYDDWCTREFSMHSWRVSLATKAAEELLTESERHDRD